jgi:hypothetical protein
MTLSQKFRTCLPARWIDVVLLRNTRFPGPRCARQDDRGVLGRRSGDALRAKPDIPAFKSST